MRAPILATALFLSCGQAVPPTPDPLSLDDPAEDTAHDDTHAQALPIPVPIMVPFREPVLDGCVHKDSGLPCLGPSPRLRPELPAVAEVPQDPKRAAKEIKAEAKEVHAKVDELIKRLQALPDPQPSTAEGPEKSKDPEG